MKIYNLKMIFTKFKTYTKHGILLFLSLIAVTFFGCSTEQDRLVPNSQQVIVQEKKVIVSCKIPEIECEFSGNKFEPTRKLIECLKKQKEAIRICNDTKVEDLSREELYGQ